MDEKIGIEETIMDEFAIDVVFDEDEGMDFSHFADDSVIPPPMPAEDDFPPGF